MAMTAGNCPRGPGYRAAAGDVGPSRPVGRLGRRHQGHAADAARHGTCGCCRSACPPLRSAITTTASPTRRCGRCCTTRRKGRGSSGPGGTATGTSMRSSRTGPWPRSTSSPDALTWVHDYHLMLVPQLIRGRRPDQPIGFFLHVPWPSPDIFARLPWREQILVGLLGADVVVVPHRALPGQLPAGVRAAAGRPGIEVHGTAIVLPDGRVVGTTAAPISIDAGEFSRLDDRAGDGRRHRRADGAVRRAHAAAGGRPARLHQGHCGAAAGGGDGAGAQPRIPH